MSPYNSIHPDIISDQERYLLQQTVLTKSYMGSGNRLGGHLTSEIGASLEFADYKVYAPGDDIKRLDWKSYARNDKYFVRRYHQEVNTHVEIILDHSASMNYYGHHKKQLTYSKWDCARSLTTLLAQISIASGENFGLTFSPTLGRSLPSSSGEQQLQHLENIFAKVKTHGHADLSKAIKKLQNKLKSKSQIVVISDFLDTDEDFLKSLKSLKEQKHHVQILQILHFDEINFPFDGKYLFLDPDGEGERQSENQAEDLRKHYMQTFQSYNDKLVNSLKLMQVPFMRHSIEQSLFLFIQKLLMPKEQR